MIAARPRWIPLLQGAVVVAVVTQAALLLVVAPRYWWLGFAMVVACAMAFLGAFRPALLVSLAVLVRPLLDGMTQSQVGGQSGANPAGLIGLLLVATLIVYGASRRKVFQPSATVSFAVILLVSVLAAVNGIAGLGGALGLKPIAELVRISALFAVYLLAATLFTTREQVERLFLYVGLSAVIPALFGLYTLWVTGPDKAAGVSTETIGRISGTFSGPIPFSTYLAIASLILIFLPKDRLRVWIRLPALAVMLTALVGTYTREGWIVFLVGMVMLGWRRHRAVLATAVVIIVALVFLVPTVGNRVLPERGNHKTGQTYDSYTWRLDTWAGLIRKWASDSPAAGFGLKSVPTVNPRQLRVQNQPARGFDAHNSVVKLLVEGGIPLLAAYVVFFVVILRTTRRLARARWPLQSYARLLFVLWITVLVVGVGTDDVLSATATLFAVLAVTGAVEGAYRRWLAGAEPPVESRLVRQGERSPRSPRRENQGLREPLPAPSAMSG
jgi:O-antigen ligase